VSHGVHASTGGAGRHRSERGQVIGFFVVWMVVLLGIAAMSIDAGFWYLDHTRAQAAADRAALAAASDLPSATQPAFNADATLTSINLKNLPTGSVAFTATQSQGSAALDTVQATATKGSSIIFARLLGVTSVNVSATATAAVQSYLGHGVDTAPFAVDPSSLVYGTPVNVKVDPGNQVSPGNFGALDLTQSPGCTTSNGAANYRDMLGRSSQSCGLVVGGAVSSETGNMAGPTEQGLTDRGTINNFDPNQLLVSDGHGGQSVSDWNHPNLMVIPVIQSWGNGHSALTIIGFQYFIVTSFTKTTVTGIFVHLTGTPSDWLCPTPTDPNASCSTGTYDPTTGPTTIRLVS
jgi:Flp pilus assembly protein TadG